MPVFDQRLPMCEVQSSDLPDRLPTLFEMAAMVIDQLAEWIARLYEQILMAHLIRELGEPYERDARFRWHRCPDCGSRSARRKGWEPRTVSVPQLGELTFERPQVECRDCSRTWKPFDREIGLEEGRNHMRAALERPLRALCETSYRRAAEAYPESPSASVLWRRVQQSQPDLPTGAQANEEVCVLDATGIPGREEGKQLALGIAHQVREGGVVYNRPVLERRPVAACCGRERDLADRLDEQQICWAIHDGELALEEVVDHPVRCRWHVGYSASYFLYQDDLKGDRNKELASEIRDLVSELPDEAEKAEDQLRAWVERRRGKAPRTATHVEEAIDELLEPIEADRDLPVQTTSPAEREIRELNRRFENGGQWTENGAENLLHHLQMYRHHPDKYTRWITQSDTRPEPAEPKVS